VGALMCAVGISGILNRNVKYLNMFAIFYFVEVAMSMAFTTVLGVVGASMKEDVCKSLVGNPDSNGNTPEDNDNLIKRCEETYPALLSVAIVGMCVGIAVRLYFYLAIRSYARQLQRENEQDCVRVIHIVPGVSAHAVFVPEALPAYTPAYKPTDEKTPLL